ncbi:cuticle protein 10.9-like [Uloborus diversus]|uniref:cuticle protein 10.9-like n=1 Tax=Uloborus diversus TaxID=327109 RepID=UPI002409DB47|nr:cuticle protein 10.9-like [Uloborus diversus]
MKALIVFVSLLATVFAQLPAPNAVPIPYSFNYMANTEDGGSSSHEENGDGAGRVTGSYTVSNLEGHTRTVEYVADEAGFRATIRTNEPGTANQNPADVVVESSAAEAGPVLTSAPAPKPPASTRTGVRYVLVPITE